MQQFDGKTAVITGAASGIGLALARQCGRLQMQLVLADIEEQALEQAAAALRQEGYTLHTVLCDVSQQQAVERLAAETVDRFGGCHLLFNNAGVSAGTSVLQTTVNDWQWVLGVNLMGVIYGVQAFLPIMERQNEPAHIVNTASIAGLIAGPTMVAYRVSKHSVVVLSETLYLELQQSGSQVGVSVLCPAWVDTKIYESERNRPQQLHNRETGSDAQFEPQALMAEEIQNNMLSPQVIATQTLEAVRDERFYILTHPRYTGAVAVRMKDILAGRNPTNLIAAG